MISINELIYESFNFNPDQETLEALGKADRDVALLHAHGAPTNADERDAVAETQG